MKREMQPEGNYYDKYNTKNKIEQWLMNQFFCRCAGILDTVTLEHGRILEAGCGEGNFTRFLFEKFVIGTCGNHKSAEKEFVKIEAFDLSRKCVQQAKQKCPGVHFQTGSIYERKTEVPYDLVVASEVLEHMEHPEQALDKLFEAANGYLFLTVPNEPLWRILNMVRGKYWSRLGNTPGHVQHWNRRTLTKLILARGGGKNCIYKSCISLSVANCSCKNKIVSLTGLQIGKLI